MNEGKGNRGRGGNACELRGKEVGDSDGAAWNSWLIPTHGRTLEYMMKVNFSLV